MANPNSKLFLVRAMLIVAAGFWVFSPALCGDWLWDDDTDIVHNALLQSPDGLRTIWLEPSQLTAYYPITFSVEWIEWHLWTTNSPGYHLISILLNILSSLLLWRLFSKLGLRYAWLGGLIFVVHPMNVESVAWIVELKNTLSMPFILLAMSAWIDYDQNRCVRDYGLAWGLFLTAMLCKTTVMMFPVVILLHAWWRRGRVGRSDLLASLPFFAVSVILGLATTWLQQHHTILTSDIPLGGFFSRMACIGLSFSFYFSKFFLPIDLMPIYPQWKINPPSLIQFLPWPILSAVLFWFWTKRETWGRSALLGAGFFLINLVPILGFKLFSYMGFTWVMDHFCYVPMIGLIGLTIAALAQVEDLLPPSQRPILIGFAVLAIAFLMFQCQSYAKIFSNQQALWTYALQHNETAWPAHDNLGNVLFVEGRMADAVRHYQISIQINPYRFEAHNNLGLALALQGQTADAIAQYQQALNIFPFFTQGHLNLADTLVKAGRISEAMEQYRQALKIDPNCSDARVKLQTLQKSNP